jgi:hypothetical protein
MLELTALAILVVSAAVLMAPLRRRVTLPGWLARARERGRPGVPVTAWLGAVLVMGVCWLIGEQRGLAGVALLLLWVLAPLVAILVTGLWIRRPGTGRR